MHGFLFLDDYLDNILAGARQEYVPASCLPPCILTLSLQCSHRPCQDAKSEKGGNETAQDSVETEECCGSVIQRAYCRPNMDPYDLLSL